MTAIDTLLADFEVLDDWEDRYRHVIELGKELAPLPEADHSPENKVRGCASQVWITSDTTETPQGPVLAFRGDSDALIVKGLIAIAFMIYSGRPRATFSLPMRARSWASWGLPRISRSSARTASLP